MIRILHGDARAVLPTLEAASVQCVVCSPPYYGLRDYGVAGQIGAEATPTDYIAALVGVFAEVRRVLRDDGTVWLNLGDSYANDGKWGGETGGKQAYLDDDNRKRVGREKRITGLKPKDLMMIPARVAIALQDEGWWVRSDIIWHKVAPMPESVTDRCTRAHEYVFMLTKAARYFYNAAEARDPLLPTSVARLIQPGIEDQIGSDRANGGAKTNGPMKAVAAHFGGRIKSQVNDQTRLASGNEWSADPGSGANWRDVWPIASEGFADGHFAVMPAALAERCIRAGSRAGDTVLDPFAGAATTLMVADRLQRHAVGIELNAEYVAMARARITKDAGMFAEIADAP